MSDAGFREAAERYAEARGDSPRDQLERTGLAQSAFDAAMSEFDEPLVCGIEDPESCESCQ
jgi:hypothetical protein